MSFTYWLNMPPPEHDRLALFDLDGVVCDDRHRVHYALSRDWCEYFERIDADRVWPQGRELFDNACILNFDVGYLTGRREDLRRGTRDWLRTHRFNHTLPLIMRQSADRRPLAEVKAGVVTEALRHYREVILYDDDPHVIELVGQVPGAKARHCTWHIKPQRLVKKGRA